MTAAALAVLQFVGLSILVGMTTFGVLTNEPGTTITGVVMLAKPIANRIASVIPNLSVASNARSEFAKLKSTLEHARMVLGHACVAHEHVQKVRNTRLPCSFTLFQNAALELADLIQQFDVNPTVSALFNILRPTGNARREITQSIATVTGAWQAVQNELLLMPATACVTRPRVDDALVYETIRRAVKLSDMNISSTTSTPSAAGRRRRAQAAEGDRQGS